MGVATVILGWACGIEALKSVVPGLISMKVNSALCFVLLGGALASAPHQAWRPIRWALLTGAAGIAVATAFEYGAGRDLGIDELFVRDLVSRRSNLPPDSLKS